MLSYRWMQAPKGIHVPLEDCIVVVRPRGFSEGWLAEVHDPEKDSKCKNVSGFASIARVESVFLLNLWSHIHLRSLELGNIYVNGLDHSEVTELKGAVGGHQDVLQLDVEVR